MSETTRLSNFGRAEERRSLDSGSLNRAGSTVDKLSEGVIGVIVINIVCSCFVNDRVAAVVVVVEDPGQFHWKLEDLVVSYTSKAEIPVSSDSVIRDFEGGSSFLCLIRSSFST